MFGSVHARPDPKLAMIFWSESAPLALAVTSRPVGAHSDDKLAEGGGRGGKGGVKERRKKGGTEGGSVSHLWQNLETLTWQVGKNNNL